MLSSSHDMVVPYVLAYMTRESDREKEVLLSMRSSQASFGASKYAMIGGKINQGESPTQALIREVKEEIGCIIEAPLEMCQVLYFKGHTRTCTAFVFNIESWEGVPENKEPEKHDHIGWFLLDELPSTLLERHAFMIHAIQNCIPYAEWGFE